MNIAVRSPNAHASLRVGLAGWLAGWLVGPHSHWMDCLLDGIRCMMRGEPGTLVPASLPRRDGERPMPGLLRRTAMMELPACMGARVEGLCHLSCWLISNHLHDLHLITPAVACGILIYTRMSPA